MVKKKIVWSENSQKDLLNIFDYWNSAIGNNKYSRKIKRQISNDLKLYAIKPEIAKPTVINNIRYFNYKYYLIFFKILPTEINVLRIWDGRRNPKESPLKT